MLDPLELELQIVVSCHVCDRNQTQILWKSLMLRSCYFYKAFSTD